MRSFVNSPLKSLVFAALLAGTTALPAAALDLELLTSPKDTDLAKSLRSVSLVVAESKEDDTTAQDLLAAAQADYARLVAMLYEAGFFAPEISIRIDGREAAEISPLAQLPDIKRIEISVKSGEKFHFGAVSVGPQAPGAPASPALSSGALASLTSIQNALQSALDNWRASGHPKAALSRENIVADHTADQIDVTLEIAPGPRATFGQTLVSGDSAVRAERIQRIAGIPMGQVYDPAALDRATVRLRRSGAFNSVTLREAETLGPNNMLDIEVAVVDAKPNRFGLGAEIQSDQGLSLSGFWLHRNLLGGAERLRIDGDISGLAGETGGHDLLLSAGLTVPSALGTKSDLYSIAQIERLEEPLYLSEQVGLEVGVQKYISDELSFDLGIALERSRVEDDFGDRSFSLITFPGSITWDRRNDPLDPTEGTYLRVDAEPFHDFVASSTGLRSALEARGYRQLTGDDGIVLAGRFKLGTVLGATIEQTPPDMLFFSGGSDTVRGHPYQSLSIDTGLIETGGRSFMGASAELRVPVIKNLDAVAFYDIGYVGENSFYDDTGGLHSGAGLGLRYQTGFGPLRLDVAAPISGGTDKGIQIYLGVGQAF